MELPPAYLDYSVMVRHQFLERNEQFLQQRLIFDRYRTVHVSLPAPTFFNFQAKRRYFITREQANEYERRTEAARLQAAALQAVAAASQYNPNYDFGYPSGQQWPQTNLGQKPKLGEVHISHRHYIHVHTLILVVGAHTFSLYYPCQFIFFSKPSSCVFEKS